MVGRGLRFRACGEERKMIRTLSEEIYRETLDDFMVNWVLDWPVGLFLPRMYALFWIPCVFCIGLMVARLFRRRVALLSVRRCVILLGGACALWVVHFASGVLFIYARAASQPGDTYDYRPWGVGYAYIIRGCIVLLLASVAVCQNLLFRKDGDKQVDAGEDGQAKGEAEEGEE